MSFVKCGLIQPYHSSTLLLMIKVGERLADILKWTTQEDEILKQNYEKYSYQELVEKFFPERSVPSVRGRIKSLGLQSKTFRWTDEDIKLLTEKY